MLIIKSKGFLRGGGMDKETAEIGRVNQSESYQRTTVKIVGGAEWLSVITTLSFSRAVDRILLNILRSVCRENAFARRSCAMHPLTGGLKEERTNDVGSLRIRRTQISVAHVYPHNWDTRRACSYHNGRNQLKAQLNSVASSRVQLL